MKRCIANISFVFLVFLFILSCNKNNNINNESYGKKVVLSNEFNMNQYNKIMLKNNFESKNFKIISFMDSVPHENYSFTEWNKFMKELDLITSGGVGLVFVVTKPKRINLDSCLYKRGNFLVLIDSIGKINSINKSLIEKSSCFLLNYNNEIQVAGDPILEINIKDMYINYINENKNIERKHSITYVDFSSDSILIGDVKSFSNIIREINLTNIGKCPLIINQILTTCGCTKVEFEYRPIYQGDTARIKVNIIPDNTGPFYREVFIYCNCSYSPIKFHIKGNVN